MRHIIPTTTLFTVAFLATLISNTESTNRANAKLALILTPDDLPEASGSEDSESVEVPVTEMSPSAPENIPVMEFATNPEQSQDSIEQILARSMTRSANAVQEIRLEGESRSPVFIPEFSASSPWANVAANQNSTRENTSGAQNSSLSRAMPPPIFPRTTVTRSPVTPLNQGSGSRSPVVPEIVEQPTVQTKPVSRNYGRNPLPVPEPPPNYPRAIATVPNTPRVQSASIREQIPPRDRNSGAGVGNSSPSSLPVLSSGEPIAIRENTQVGDPVPDGVWNAIGLGGDSRPGSAKDLLPVSGGESVTPSNSSQRIAAVPDPVPPLPNAIGLGGDSQRIAQTHNNIYRPNPQDVQVIREQVQNLEENAVVDELIEGSPALSIFNPTGYGADNNTGYLSATYQSRTRFVENDDGAVAIGFGFGDAQDAVGVELSYTLASVFGQNRDVGTGGFNVKVHKQFADDWAVAAGWNGFVFLGEDDGFEDSIYGAVTKVIRTQESLDSPLSRVALTAGVGNGQFRTEKAMEDGDDSVNVFGSAAVRVAKPVSVIAEWTGQDLAVGASIAPFKNVPLVITPAVRDITGAGDGARFVLGAGVGFRF